MNEPIQEITELEALIAEDEPEKPVDDSALKFSKVAYSLAVVLLDAVTAWTIWQLTTFWYYGLIWFCAGAVFFYLHHKNWERPGNNSDQIRLSTTGLIVSVVSMLVMAVVVGGFFIAGLFGQVADAMWTEIGIVGGSILLFGWHAVQVAQYYFKDDNFKITNAVTRAKAVASKKIKIAEAAGDVVEAHERARQKRHANYKKHGDRGAVDAAIRKIEGGQGKVSYASDTQQVKPKDNGKDFQQGSRQ